MRRGLAAGALVSFAFVAVGVALAGSAPQPNVGDVIGQLGCRPGTPSGGTSGVAQKNCVALAHAVFEYQKDTIASEQRVADMRSDQEALRDELEDLAGLGAEAVAPKAAPAEPSQTPGVGSTADELGCGAIQEAHALIDRARCEALAQLVFNLSKSTAGLKQTLAYMSSDQASLQGKLDVSGGATTQALQQLMDTQSLAIATTSALLEVIAETQEEMTQNVPDLGEPITTRLQLYLDAFSQTAATLSNIQKLIAATQHAIIQSLFDPRLTVTPASLTLFVDYTLTGRGFHPNSTVDFTLADPNFNGGIPYYHQAATTDANGSVTIINQLGNACNGLQYNLIFAITDALGVTASTTVHVTNTCP